MSTIHNVEPEFYALGRRLIQIPGIVLRFDAQIDTSNSEDSTEYVSTSLDDPEANVFTHYLYIETPDHRGDEGDVSYYNACSYDLETTTLASQINLVHKIYPNMRVTAELKLVPREPEEPKVQARMHRHDMIVELVSEMINEIEEMALAGQRSELETWLAPILHQHLAAQHMNEGDDAIADMYESRLCHPPIGWEER